MRIKVLHCVSLSQCSYTEQKTQTENTLTEKKQIDDTNLSFQQIKIN